jgi:tRNA(Ile)-lysidine synthase
MSDVARSVARTIRRAGLAGPGDRIAVAVSGGADSVALSLLLNNLAPVLGATVVGLIHVNHGLRGADADEDEAFCRALAARLGLAFEVHRADVVSLARTRHLSIEAAARLARYDWFPAAAERLNANRVATGHTADDQAETVLLRLLRGSGARGVSGIRLRRGMYVRPLLHCRRKALREWLQEIGEGWREDASNADTRVPRNRVRHEVMPLVENLAPGAVTALARHAALAADDEAYLTRIAEAMVAGATSGGNFARPQLSASVLTSQPPAIARRIIRVLAERVAPGRALSFRHIEAVRRLAATDKPHSRLDLPGLFVEKAGSALRLTEAPVLTRNQSQPWMAWPERLLFFPGSVDLPEVGLTLEVRPATGAPAAVSKSLGSAAAPGPAWQVSIRAAAALATSSLIVRNRRPGDRFQPLGAPGRRKLQDVLVDRKIPRTERDAVPIVTTVTGEILWVAGVAVAEACRIRTPEDSVLLLELRKYQ